MNKSIIDHTITSFWLFKGQSISIAALLILGDNTGSDTLIYNYIYNDDKQLNT